MTRILNRQAPRPWRQSGPQWTAQNPILFSGEFAYDTTAENLKIGDGVTHWNDLKWALPIVQTSTPPVAPAGSVWLKPAP